MELLNYKTLLLILNLVTGQWCQKMLSELKKCGDPECEGTISRVQAKRDFKGPDCRYLTFKAGAVIFVYYKLSGKRDDLWAGSIDKEFGYFPKDAVNLEEEYVSKNVDIPTKETDFLCLNGEEYTAESEDDSEFIENFDTRLSGNPNTEHEIKDYFPDAHLQNHMHVSFQGSQPKSVDHQITGSVNGLNQELERKNIHGYVDLSDTLNDREVKSDAKRQDTDNSYVDSSWIGSHVKGWLGVGKNEGQKDKPVTESLRDNSFKSRKITLVDELKEEDEKVESGPEKSSWFGGGVTEFLGFGKKTAEPDIVSETQTDITSRDFVSENGVHQKEDSTEILNAHMLTDSQIKQTEEVMHKSENVQLKQVPNNEESKSSWFNVDLGSMLNFGQTTGKIPDASSIQPKAEIIAASEGNLQKTAEKLITSADTLQHTKEDDTMPDDSLQQDKTKEYEISGNSLPQYKTEKDVISDSTHLQHKTEEFTSQNNQEVFITDDESKRDTKENKEKSGILNNDDTQKTDIETKEKSRWQYMNIANLINLGGSQHEKNEFQNAVKKKECPDMYEKGASEEHKDKQQIEESVYKSKDQPEFTVLENMAKASETSFGNAQTEEKKDGIQQYENDAKRAPDQSLFSTKTVHHEHTSLKTPLKQHQKSIHQPKPDTVSQMTLEQTSHEYLGNITPSRNDASLQSVSQISEDAVSHTDEKNTSYQNIWNIFDMISILRPNWTKLQSSTKKAVEALPEDIRPGPDLYGIPWEVVVFTTFIGLFTVLALFRTFQMVRSRSYIAREKKLGSKISELLEEKCMVLETLSNCKQEYEKLDSSLKNTKHLEDQEESLSFQDTCEKLAKSNAALMDSAEQLKQELEAEKSKRQQQDDALAELQKSLHLLKDEARTLKAQIEESKTTVKVFEINQERLLISLQTEREETVHLQESNEQLLRESEGWCERVGELTEQIKMCELSNKDMEDVLNDREEQIKSITACLLKLKVWESDVDDCFEENKTWDLETRGGIENGEYLDDQQKRKVKKLLYAAKLNAALKSMEAEKNEVCTQLHNELEAKRELTERIEKLKSEEISIHSDRSCYENELQKLQQKLKVMQELYQENEMQLHRKLTVEEKQRLQKEEKLSKADEKMNLAAEELKSYRQRAQDLEDELERTIKSYQNQISLHEKKAHDNWLAARAADRELGDVKRENTHLRQKLTETEFKLDVLEKDPHALDVQNKVYLRECSPYRTAVLSRPSSETRAFLSPPTLMEGPPRLSPLFPGGPGGRGGTRGAVNYLDHPPVESGEQSSDRLSDHHGAHSDSGSLSPTWERQISVPLTGAPLRRTEPGYHMPLPSGRMSGPAELRIYSSHSLDKPDEHPSVENHLEQVPDTSAFNENVSSMLTSSRNQPIFPVRETNTDPGFIAPPAPNIRGPLLPLDPRGFFRRGPFPIHGPPDRLPPPEFIGVPPPLLRMRVPPPLPEHFLQFPPVRDGFPPVRDGFLPAGRLPPQNPHMLLARLSSPPPSQTEAESGVSQHDN